MFRITSCSFSEQCAGSPYASCLRGKCSCIEGYTAEGSTYCVQRNRVLNQTCSFSEQCTGSPYASCLGGKCSCIEGYTAKNVTSCIQKEANIGNTAGALFGGLLLGVILTTVAAVFTYRRSKTHGNKRTGNADPVLARVTVTVFLSFPRYTIAVFDRGMDCDRDDTATV
uniref:Uncharacterized protein n=1 Tax=Magallana gigas TaxID=29159 RepID=K1PGB4_MAGGI